MVSNQRFTPIDPCADPRPPAEDAATRLRRLADDLERRFRRATGLEVITVAVDPDDHGSLFPWRAHPLCGDRCDQPTCRRRWIHHAEELHGHGTAHWHRCDCGMYCAVAPIKVNEQCIAAARLVCSNDLPEETISAHAELLALLAECLPRCLATEAAEAGDATPVDHAVSHPLVAKALAHIRKHLAEQDLTVARVAGALDVNDTYLGHLFAREIGERMSRYIARKRVERACHLLANTDWKIKRIAFACGFANASWFGQRFRAEVGQAPGDYRRKHQKSFPPSLDSA